MALRIYSNKTLQDNWNEDRLQSSCSVDEAKKVWGGTGSKTLVNRADEGFPDVSKRVSDYDQAFINVPHHSRFNQPYTKERILPAASSAEAGLVETTNTFFQSPVLEVRPHAKPKTGPRNHEMYQPRAAGRDPSELGLNITRPTHINAATESARWVTTNQQMFVDAPSKARQQQPPPNKFDEERFSGGLPASERGRLSSTDRNFHRHEMFKRDNGSVGDCMTGV